ncbi:hypothetical protein TWF694_007745 [Orbilia ellipsospora]|uniref:DUF7587 domain-containing protein n=1 Tax=Orbilia ellipsospora TaxID=2528407 RepID=A0AAV9XM03_9PEZI
MSSTPEEQVIRNIPVSLMTSIDDGETEEATSSTNESNKLDALNSISNSYHGELSSKVEPVSRVSSQADLFSNEHSQILKISNEATLQSTHAENNQLLGIDNAGNPPEVVHSRTEAKFERFFEELQEEVTMVDPQEDTQAQEEEEEVINDGENPFHITIEKQSTKDIDGIYYPSPAELQFSSDSRIYPETPVAAAIPPTLSDTTLLGSPADDNESESSRKRFRLSVQQYKTKRTPQYTGGDERFAFDRICPNSKFYHTQPDPNRDPVRRVLFPSIRKKKAEGDSNEDPDRTQALIEDALNDSAIRSKDNIESDPVDPLEKYRHTWLDSNLTSLYVLKRWYKNGPANIRDVLNRLMGINISSGAYSMQFNEFINKAKERNLRTFKEVFIDTPFTDPEMQWFDVKEELLAASEGAGVQLKPRDKDDEDVLKAYEDIKQTQMAERMRLSLSEFIHTPGKSPVVISLVASDSEEDSEPDTPCKVPSMKRKSECLKSKPEKAQTRHRRSILPKNILFRYWDDESYGYNSPDLIRAGLFRDPSQPIPDPPEVDTPEFDKHAANHINRKKIPTPMISTSNSLMWVLRKAGLSRRWFNATNPRIAIIDPRYLKSMFQVSDLIAGLCKREDMIEAAHRYGGHYDILVWGEIPKEAIVNIVDYLELLRATTVSRQIHTHFRMDIVSRPKIKSVIFGMKFAVACAEELKEAVEGFANIVLGPAAEADIKDRFAKNVGID